MFTSLRNFMSRHKKKFIVTGVIIGGGVLAVRFAQKKLQEFQETQAKEFFEKARRFQYFELTERTCNQTINGLAFGLYDVIIANLNSDELLTKLREQPNNKMEIWNELKVLSFTKLTTLVYSSALLVITLRIQLNLLGGYLYKDINEEENKKLVTQEIQSQYLSLIQHFLTDGVNELIRVIQKNVDKILKRYNLKQKLTLADAEAIFWSIQMAVNSEIGTSFGQLVLQENDDFNSNNNALLNKMFNETFDLLETCEVNTLLSNHLSHGFSLATDQLAEFYTLPKNGTPPKPLMNGDTVSDQLAILRGAASTKKTLNDESIVNINTIEIPLAKIIPIVNGLTSNIYNGDMNHRQQAQQNLTTSLYKLFMESDKIKIFGANIYEAFCQ